MEITLIVTRMFGGLVLFMFGISMLSNIFKKIAGGRLRVLLKKATDSVLKGMTSGALVTFIIQSSSVTVLLLLGLVNAGIMNLRQAIFVILGSEIGTTITAQIVSFRVKELFYPILIIGFSLRTLSSREKIGNSGDILFCLGLIFLAMNMMAGAAKPLKELPLVLDLVRDLGLTPLFGILIGAMVSAITSSSSATTGLVIAMSMEGVIDLPAGIALIIGANIGTCALELVASIGTSAAARRTGLAQLIINLFGAALFYPFLTPFASLVELTATETPRLIANAHTLFNLLVSLACIPLIGVIIYLLKLFVPGPAESPRSAYGNLDEKFLEVPAIALYEAEEEASRMADMVREMISNAKLGFFDNDRDALKALKDKEKTVDDMHGKLTLYLNRIRNIMLSEKDLARKRALVHTITDIERIGDLAENIAGYSQQEGVVFSNQARRELETFFDRASGIYTAAADSLRKRRKTMAPDIGRMENDINALEAEFRGKYIIGSLGLDQARPRPDALYPNVLHDLERISDHAGNIAAHVMKIA